MPYAQEHLHRDGQALGVQVYPGFDDPDRPAVVILPAMGTPARFYRPLAQALEAGPPGAEGARVGVAVVDLRGIGASTPPPSRAARYGYAELTDDVGAVLDALRPRTAGRRIFLLGHSLGGQAGLMHLARTGRTDIAGMILVAVALPYFRAYPRGRRLPVLGLTQSIGVVSTLLRVWPGWGFGGREAARVMTDWAWTARHGHFPGVSDEQLATVRTPALAISLPRDALTPAPVVDYTADKLTGAAVTRLRLSGTLDHFSWARTPESLISPIANFIRGVPSVES